MHRPSGVGSMDRRKAPPMTSDENPHKGVCWGYHHCSDNFPCPGCQTRRAWSEGSAHGYAKARAGLVAWLREHKDVLWTGPTWAAFIEVGKDQGE